MDDYYFYEDVDGVAPCEFCGEPFPFSELILHQTSHMVEENVYEYPLFDDVVIVKQQESSTSEVKKIVEEIQLDTEEPQVIMEEKEIKKPDSIKEPKLVYEKKLQSPVKSNKSEEKKLPDETKKEIAKKSGVKSLLYDTDIDPIQELEREKEVYKMPSNPVLNIKEKDEEDINNLSDNDSSETLEEFWKRARDFLKRNRVKNEC